MSITCKERIKVQGREISFTVLVLQKNLQHLLFWRVAYSTWFCLAHQNVCPWQNYALEANCFVGSKNETLLIEFFINWYLVRKNILNFCFILIFVSNANDIRKESEANGFFSAWNLLRITNMLIIVRLFRIIPSIKVNMIILLRSISNFSSNKVLVCKVHFEN